MNEYIQITLGGSQFRYYPSTKRPYGDVFIVDADKAYSDNKCVIFFDKSDNIYDWDYNDGDY